MPALRADNVVASLRSVSGFAGEHGLVEKDLSRGEAPICSNHTACLRRIVLEL